MEEQRTVWSRGEGRGDDAGTWPACIRLSLARASGISAGHLTAPSRPHSRFHHCHLPRAGRRQSTPSAPPPSPRLLSAPLPLPCSPCWTAMRADVGHRVPTPRPPRAPSETCPRARAAPSSTPGDALAPFLPSSTPARTATPLNNIGTACDGKRDDPSANTVSPEQAVRSVAMALQVPGTSQKCSWWMLISRPCRSSTMYTMGSCFACRSALQQGGNKRPPRMQTEPRRIPVTLSPTALATSRPS